MAKQLPRVEHEQRLFDIDKMIAIDETYDWLAEQWGVSRPGAFMWVQNHALEQQKDYLPRVRGRRDNARVAIRLEAVRDLRRHGWTDTRIALVCGITSAALSQFLTRHAPDGVDQALKDLSRAIRHGEDCVA